MAANPIPISDADVLFDCVIPQTSKWLYDTLQGFVDDESSVTVEPSIMTPAPPSPPTVCFHVRAASTDVGKVIGKNGQMARHLRSVLLARGKKYGALFTLNIVEQRPR